MWECTAKVNKVAQRLLPFRNVYNGSFMSANFIINRQHAFNSSHAVTSENLSFFPKVFRRRCLQMTTYEGLVYFRAMVFV